MCLHIWNSINIRWTFTFIFYTTCTRPCRITLFRF
uniref:Bm13087 n=1 Tax=Brugia malayi TaxID=6279 RepID=A0A0J9XT28_BRUMA|nr:Bm13087 [Brugia malayi]